MFYDFKFCKQYSEERQYRHKKKEHRPAIDENWTWKNNGISICSLQEIIIMIISWGYFPLSVAEKNRFLFKLIKLN